MLSNTATSHDAFPGAPGTAAVGDVEERASSTSRARDEVSHARNLKIRRSYLELVSSASTCEDEVERERMLSRAEALAEQFVDLNSGLAAQQARRFVTDATPEEDCMGYAVQGLWEAFTRWDPERDITFSTFSRRFISGRLMRAVRRSEFSHLSETEWADRARVIRMRGEMTAELGREPSHEELASRSGLSLELIDRMFRAPVGSLDARQDVRGDSDEAMYDELEPDVADFVVSSEDMEPLLAELNDLELFVTLLMSPSLRIAPSSMTEIDQRAGLGRNVVSAALFSSEVKMSRALLSGVLDRDPSAEEVAAEMPSGPAVAKVEQRMVAADYLPELRGALVRVRALAHDVRSSGAPDSMVRAAAARVASVTSRVCAAFVPVVEELAAELEYADERYPGVFLPAEPEVVLDALWEEFREGWPHGTRHRTVLRRVRDRLLATHRRVDDKVVSCYPSQGEVLPSSPRELSVVFSEPVSRVDVKLTDAAGTQLAAAVSHQGAEVAVALSDDLPEGGYLLSWEAVSAYNHAISGATSFAVGEASPPPVPAVGREPLGISAGWVLARISAR